MTYATSTASGLLIIAFSIACGGTASDSNEGSSGGAGQGGGGSSAANGGGSGKGAAGGMSAGGTSAGGSSAGGLGGSGAVNAGGSGGLQCTPPQCIQICEGGNCICMCEGTGGLGGGGSGGAATCASLNVTRQEALQAATSCNAELSGQCTGSATVPDQCACPRIVNDGQPDDVQAAQAAYDAWVQAGCGPYACGAACSEGTTGICQGQGGPSGICAWAQ